ncbi:MULTISPECIES: 3'-5' exonuclease [unclassified Psychrobacter]|uniref:3'-5' exonuclease n=1 Tax=unclassified Psychrobacter TaxID=196806 RepID=UPI0018F5C650|nr:MULTISPECIES: 3'-5' exonuclease [unclassified Psychrobacter]
MSMMQRLKRQWQRRQLTRDGLEYLFAPPSAGEWVAIDCEMSGLNPKRHHLLSIAAIHINHNHIDTGNGLHLICKPPVPPTSDSIVIHGLRGVDVALGMDYAAMLALLLPFIGNRPIVGFCPLLDMAFLNPLVKEYMGTPLPNEVIDIRALYSRRTGNRTEGILSPDQHLSAILAHFDIPYVETHNAFDDALMTAMAFLHLKRVRG